jgi:hypothetical protein
MYKPFQKLISVTMALLVLISTLSFSIEKHYCGDDLIDVAIFSDTQKCESEPADKGSRLMTQSCCKDVVHFLEGQDELSLEKTKVLNTNQKVFIMSFAYVFSGLNSLDTQNNITFKHYIPPKVVRDIQALHAVFLI